MQRRTFWRLLTPWRNPVPPTVPMSGPVVFHCPGCKQQVRDEDRRCPGCGRPLP